MSWKGNVLYFVNIYSSCFLILKREIWSELINYKSKFLGGK